MSRGLNERFKNDLLSGDLSKILDLVQNDNTLDLEIRENYINIYYRGGNLIKIELKGGSYTFDFDFNYLTVDSPLKTDMELSFKDKNWLRYFTFTKQVMDYYFTKEKRKEEREYQQLVVRENNNSSIANGTDYFIVDIEYDIDRNARFDIIAIEWISKPSIRKLQKAYKPKLVVFEMKYGDGALTDPSGIRKHLNDFKTFISNKATVDNFKQEMMVIFKQKRELGLIPCLSKASNKNEVVKFDEEIEFVFLIANHDPAKGNFKQEIDNYSDLFASFIVSNFNGYGLYKTNIYSCADFLERFPNQIYES